MKKILFISSLDLSKDKLKYDGVMKKLLYQIETLEEMGCDVDYIASINDGLYLKNNKSFKTQRLINKAPTFYETMESLYQYLYKHISSLDYNVVYIRYEHLSWAMSRFCKKIRTKGEKKNVVVLAELPTYMGKWELGASLMTKVKFVINKVKRFIIPLNVSKIVTFSDHNRLYGIDTIRIENFVNVSKVPIKELNESKDIHLIGVAMMTPSHGYDRVISGLKNYYTTDPKRKVYFHIVGDGYILPKWKELVNIHKLQEYVIFEGIKSGIELNELFNKCQIAVATLAIFRKKCPKASELKIREYTARGIPFIYSAYEPQFEEKTFCYKVQHNETPINITDVINYYEQLDIPQVTKEMRNFAITDCTCRTQFEKIFQLIN